MLLVLFASVAAIPAFADDHCTVPLTDWQPREVLQRKLESEGLTVEAIRSHDGCYGVVVRDAQGRAAKIRFDPATLERVDGDHGERRHHDGRNDDD
ncbi:MAG: PepSY domain-containing protein [Phyllobacteriaceae bacterium]|nr:PepSY domain-containing protein [Phyllobacteriaceae bacterium]